MVMKQTQTKMFDFSDVGLDFCVGSKSLFPDRFKKMLALGYNEQTVASVSISGNQVTLNYGVSHGYVADRVLKIKTGALAEINSSEFWIDSVTTNTVTITIDNPPSEISGNFTTIIAPLGWDLVFEQANIHIYKFKHIDDSDLFIRLCFQNNANHRNCVSPCVGSSADLLSGVITDSNSLLSNRSIVTQSDNFKWEFSAEPASAYNDYSYSQGVSLFGKSCVVGSKYHFIISSCTGKSEDALRINGVLATATTYPNLQIPILLGEQYGNIAGSSDWYQSDHVRAYIGNFRCTFVGDGSVQGYGQNRILPTPVSDKSSFLSAEINPFNVTTLEPLRLFEYSSAQHLGYVYGAYLCRYSASNRPNFNRNTLPLIEYEMDFDSKVIIHGMGWNNGSSCAYLGIPVEEIKIG